MNRPAVKKWEWMTVDEQIIHLMASHGYRDGYFTHEDETPWTDDETLEAFRDDAIRRDEYHDQDHDEYKYGGGHEHTHDAVHPAEMAQAIESIRKAVKRG